MEVCNENSKVNPYELYGLEKHYINESSESRPQGHSIDSYVDSFKSFVLKKGYPCIGAQTAVNAKHLSLGLFEKMDCWRTAKELGYGLTEYLRHNERSPSDFLSYVAIFKYDTFEEEVHFEEALWSLLTRLHELDQKHFEWSPEVSSDPDRNDFSFSFGGRAFYLVGMHPNSSRLARRFDYPAIAFNLHSQFESLRKKSRFQRIKKVVRKNDVEFSGSINPMLADFGEGLEAPQYSGRIVGPDWECPFKKIKGDDSN